MSDEQIQDEESPERLVYELLGRAITYANHRRGCHAETSISECTCGRDRFLYDARYWRQAIWHRKAAPESRPAGW